MRVYFQHVFSCRGETCMPGEKLAPFFIQNILPPLNQGHYCPIISHLMFSSLGQKGESYFRVRRKTWIPSKKISAITHAKYLHQSIGGHYYPVNLFMFSSLRERVSHISLCGRNLYPGRIPIQNTPASQFEVITAQLATCMMFFLLRERVSHIHKYSVA